MGFRTVVLLVFTATLAGQCEGQIVAEEFPEEALTSCDSVGVTASKDTKPAASGATSNPIAKKSVREVSKLVGELLASDRNAEHVSDRLSMVMKMIQLAKGIELDPRLASSRTLQTSQSRLFGRLRTTKSEIERTMRREDRLKSPAKIEIRQDVLAQLNQAAGAAGIGGVQANAGNTAGNNALLTQDYGPQLVELIQRTISPQSWDVNGGLSTIRYWRPGMALVIRAPQSIHEEVSPLVGQLRQQ